MYYSHYYSKNMLNLPKLLNTWENSDYYIVWKIAIDNYFISSNSFIKFMINIEVSTIIFIYIY